MSLRLIPGGVEHEPFVPLLLLADESEPHVRAALAQGDLYVLRVASADVGAVLTTERDDSTELVLVAVTPDRQGEGFGRRLIAAVLAELHRRGAVRAVVGTSNAGIGQLAFYQKCGFRMSHIERDYFNAARGYDATSAERGIVHRDMVWFDQPLDGTLRWVADG